MIPRVEKASMEMESILQKYSRDCDAAEVEEMSYIVYTTIDEATSFVRNVNLMYNENECYAPPQT